jgi:hypothetical protein
VRFVGIHFQNNTWVSNTKSHQTNEYEWINDKHFIFYACLKYNTRTCIEASSAWNHLILLPTFRKHRLKSWCYRNVFKQKYLTWLNKYILKLHCDHINKHTVIPQNCPLLGWHSFKSNIKIQLQMYWEQSVTTLELTNSNAVYGKTSVCCVNHRNMQICRMKKEQRRSFCFACFTDKRPPDAPLSLRHTPCRGMFNSR